MAAVEEVSGERKEGMAGLGQRTSWDCARPLKGLFWRVLLEEGEWGTGAAHAHTTVLHPLDSSIASPIFTP